MQIRLANGTLGVIFEPVLDALPVEIVKTGQHEQPIVDVVFHIANMALFGL